MFDLKFAAITLRKRAKKFKKAVDSDQYQLRMVHSQGQPAALGVRTNAPAGAQPIAHRCIRGGIVDSTFSTEPIAATSDCTPQQSRYAKLLSLSSEDLNAMAVRYHRLGGHVRLRFAEVLLAIQETAELCFPSSVPPRGR